MSRGGGSSQWERQVAAQRREAERQARERARWEKEQEKGLKQRHLESQQRAAEAKAAGVEQQIKVLDEMLTSTLPLAPFSFNRMMVTPEIPRFDPGSLGRSSPLACRACGGLGAETPARAAGYMTTCSRGGGRGRVARRRGAARVWA